MIIKEYRVRLPLTVDEYQIGQLYAVAEASKDETGGGEGVEVLKNEPCEYEGKTGQYTYKIYRFSSKVPALIRTLAPSGSLEVHEEAWNCYPWCKTVLTNPYMKDKFKLVIQTIHHNDDGSVENIHAISDQDLAERDVVKIDIANDTLESKDYKKEYDPTLFHSVKTNRGPLSKDWLQKVKPIMTAYKLVTCEFKWYGLQSKVESLIQDIQFNLNLKFNRQVFCSIDNWHGMSIEDIRRLEDQTKTDLDAKRDK
eukprot:NODE_162_length_16547_cov_0.334326.p5 type:complete len:254 gc:universal NODE_162_length_16547_cov_0.334326:6332-7093(+)